MKHYRIFILAALAALAASCSVKEDLQPSSRAIRFTTNLGAYTTRATDTAFEEGDAVSLFAESPINALNVKMTYNGDNLVPEKDIFWPEDTQDIQHVNFLAVYPYREDWEDVSDLSVFSVNADQRTHELYTASDLLGASYMAIPDCETVPLNFTHRLSKVDCYINGLDGETVTDVYLADVYGKARLHIWSDMSVYTVGEKGTVRMGLTESGQDGDYAVFTAIVPPQAIDFKIMVTTDSGKQYTFARDRWYNSTSYMESARKYTMYLFLNQGNPSSDFDVEVSEWTDDNDTQFGNYTADEFQQEGYWSLVTTDADGNEVYTDLYTYGYTVRGGIEAGDDTPYRFKYEIGRREKYYGIGMSDIAPGKFVLTEDGDPFRWNGNVPLSLNYDLLGKVLTVTEDNDVWSVIGSFDGWTGDTDMTRLSYGIYTIDLEYWNEEFKFRCNHSWDVNIGNYDDEVLADQPDSRYYLTAPDGLNFKIAAPGVYRLTLDVIRQQLHVKLLEEITDATFEGMQGNWAYNDIPVSISALEGNLQISFNGIPVFAEYNHAAKSFSVRFYRLDAWTHNSYGLVYDYFYAFVKDGEGNVTASAYGENGQDLYYGTLSGGSLEITPATLDGSPFSSYRIIGLLQEGDYAGAYFDYVGELPLPQTWTRVNG